MTMTVLSVTAVAVTALGVSVRTALAQGSVVGAAMPGTMEDTFTIPYSEFDATEDSGCGKTFAGCTGELFELSHEINGTIEVLDDCTFRITGWQFDGEGPAVEWWGSKQAGDPKEFPYPANAIKIGELGAPGAYQTGSAHGGDSDVVVRLGLTEDGTQIELSDDINHISVWCEDFAVDFGNAPILCEAKAPEAEAEAEAKPPKAAAEPEAEAEAEAKAPGPVAGAEAAPELESEAGAGGSTDDVSAPSASSAFTTQSAVGAAVAVGALGLALV